MEIGRLKAIITAEDKELFRRMDAADRKGKQTSESLKRTFANTRLTLPDIKMPKMSGLSSLAAQADSFGRQLTVGVTLPLSVFGGAAVKAATDMDSLKRGLVAVSGSSAEAEKQLVRLKEVAKLPGLGFQEAIRGSINLQAAGISAELAERSLKAFGNALATVGKGKAELDGVVLALGQIESKGKVSAEEINQIAERVPQIRKAMVAAFGTADTEILQKAKLTSRQFIEAIVTQLEKLPKATGGAKNTFENLSDAAQQSMSKIGESILRVAVPALDKLTPKIEAAGKAFSELTPDAQNAILAIGGIALVAGPVLTGAAKIVSALGTIRAAMAGISFAAVGAGSAILGALMQSGGDQPTVARARENDMRNALRKAQDAARKRVGPRIDSASPSSGLSPDFMPALPSLDLRYKAGAGSGGGTKFNLAGLGGGKGGGGTKELSEFQQMAKRLKEINAEIAYLGNATSKEYKLNLQILGAEQTRSELIELIELRRNLFSDGPKNGELRQLQALDEYNQKLRESATIAPVVNSSFTSMIQESLNASEALRNLVGEFDAYNEKTLEAQVLNSEYYRILQRTNAYEAEMILNKAKQKDESTKAAEGTKILQQAMESLTDQMDELNQRGSVTLDVYKQLSRAGVDMTRPDAVDAMAKAREVDLQISINQYRDQAKERLLSFQDRLGRDFDDVIESLIAGGDRWRSAVANLARDFFNSLAEEFMLAATGGKYSSIGGLLGGLAGNLISGIGGGLGGAGEGYLGEFADGGYFGSSGFAMVGEKGPELVHFGGAGRVYDADQTAAMMGGGTTIVQNFHITAPGGRMPRETQAQVAARAAEGAQYVARRNGG